MSFAEIRGASFGSVISENNSVNFYVKVVGVQGYLTTEQRSEWGVHVNNIRVSTIQNRGINIVKFDDSMKVIDQVSFDLYDRADIDGQRFIDYMNASTNMMALFTSDAIGNTANIQAMMNKFGSSVWPEWLINATGDQTETLFNKRFSYAAFVDGKTKNIVTEATGSRGEGFAALTEYSLDTAKDLGSIGMGKSLVEDSTMYENSVYEVHMYQKETSLTNLPHIQKGEYIRLRGDFKRDQVAIDNKVECRLQVQFYDANSSYAENITLGVFPGLEWETKEFVGKINNDVSSVDIGFYHAPQILDGLGVASVRNVVIQTSNEPPKSVKKIRFGRTAPTQIFKEGTIDNQPNTVVKFTSDEQIEAIELQELDTGGYWVKLLDHNTLNKGEVFASREDVQYSITPNLYSNMRSVEDYRGFNGKFKFRIDYELDRGFIEWEQSSSPNDPVALDVRIIVNTLVDTTKPFTGISISSSTTDTVYDCDSSSEWFYAIGALKSYKTGIPANNNIESQYVRFSVWKD